MERPEDIVGDRREFWWWRWQKALREESVRRWEIFGVSAEDLVCYIYNLVGNGVMDTVDDDFGAAAAA
jgi:hypothetical protein